MKKICLLLAISLLAACLAACTGGTTPGGTAPGGTAPSGSAGGAVEITVVSSFGSGDGNRANYVEAYKAYEAATGNTVIDISDTSNEEWKKRVIADFESGSEPDVLFYFTGADADSIIKGGQVVPISEIRKYSADYASNMKDSLMPVSGVDGRQYAVPVNGYWEGLYVNKRVLAQCGVEVPGADYTWEQFIADCGKIKQSGYTPIACSLNEVPHYWFEFCVFNNGDIYNHTSLPDDAGDAVGAVWTAGLEDIKLLYDSGFFPENTASASDSESCLLMTSHKAAFLLDGSWKLGWFQDNAENLDDFTITYVPAKGERKATDIVGGLSMGYYITRKAWDDPAKRQACVEFVTAMTTDEVVNAFGALSITALKNGTTPPADADSLVMAALAMTKGCTGIVMAVQDGLIPTARDALFADAKNIATGAITPGQAIENCLSINKRQ